MSHSRLISIEAELKANTPSEWRTALPNPGFQPSGYRVVSIIHGFDAVDIGPVKLSHDQLGDLGTFDPETSISLINARIDNIADISLHNGTVSTFTITQRGTRISSMEGGIAVLIECYRKAPPAEHKSR